MLGLNTNRLGRIRIDSRLFADVRFMEQLGCLFKEFIPLKVFHLMHKDTLEYVGYHRDFKEVAEGERYPEYVAIMEFSNDEPVVLKEIITLEEQERRFKAYMDSTKPQENTYDINKCKFAQLDPHE